MPIRFSSKCRRILPRDATFIPAGWQDRGGEDLADGCYLLGFRHGGPMNVAFDPISGEMSSVPRPRGVNAFRPRRGSKSFFS